MGDAMIESDRLISARAGEYEEVQDRAIRPTLLAEYVGQPTVREQMDIFISAARGRQEALDQAECDWFALARETHARRFRQPPADRKEKARQLRFLQSRGFDAEQSFNALDLAGEEDLD